jgi:hypothetical protein
MTDKTNDISLLPERWHVLSGSWLKVIAMVSMLMDHVAMVILRYDPVFTEPLITMGRHSITWYYLLRCVGRLAFPIFCFLLVEGFQHTHDRRKYGRNLLVFALISEIPFNLTHGGHLYGWSQNVFFTLFLGFLALSVVRRWEEDRLVLPQSTIYAEHNRRMILCLLALIVAGYLLRCDYGNCGISFILLLYVLRRNEILRAAIGSCFLGARWIAGLAFIPIAFYNGRRGFIQGSFGKYLFYLFYPLHLLALYFIKVALGIG